MTGALRKAKLAKLVELEGFEDETALFAASISDSVCPAICCNPANPDCDYTDEMEPDQDLGWCEACELGTLVSALVLGGSSDERRALHLRACRLDGREARRRLVFRPVGQSAHCWRLARAVPLAGERRDDDRATASPGNCRSVRAPGERAGIAVITGYYIRGASLTTDWALIEQDERYGEQVVADGLSNKKAVALYWRKMAELYRPTGPPQLSLPL